VETYSYRINNFNQVQNRVSKENNYKNQAVISTDDNGNNSARLVPKAKGNESKLNVIIRDI